jgi:polyhydroxyalkanoate synthesis regulator phasin
VSITLQTATAVTSAALGAGAVGAGLLKAVKGLRRFARFLDGFLGDGTSKHPSVPDRLEAMETNQTQFREDQTEVKTSVEKLTSKVEALTVTVDNHVDGDAQRWLADGQEWGHKLDGQVESLDQRVSKLEAGDDPVM